MRRALRNRDFALLFAAYAVSSVGDVLYEVGVMFEVFARTGSTLQTIGVTVATRLPPFLLGPAAGVVGDRLSRKRVMIAMDVARLLLVGGLYGLSRADDVPVWMLYAIVGGLATAKAFYDPARLAAIPSVVPRDQLVAANSLMLTTLQVAYAVGYASGGLLVLRLGFQAIVLIDVLTFAVSACILTLLRLPAVAAADAGAHAGASAGLLAPALEGWRYIRGHALIRPLLAMEIMEWVPHGIWSTALMLAFTERSLGGDAVWWGWQTAAYFAGLVCGAVLAATLAGRLARRAGRAIVVNAFFNSGLTLAYALSPTLAFATVVAFLFGPPMALRDLAQDALLQSHADGRVLGRVYAARAMGTNLVFLLAAPVFAFSADHLPVRGVYLVGGALYLATAFYALGSGAIRGGRVAA
ncbi:hypothetical protein DCC79_12625 [bacterium]|nr:MAG: hypothetical protein DCC79_12625 [bacterium]